MWMKDFPLCCGLAILVGLWREEQGGDEYSDPWTAGEYGRWSRQKSDLELFEKSYKSVVFGTVAEGDDGITQAIPPATQLVARLLLAAFNSEDVPALYAVFNVDQVYQMNQYRKHGFSKVAVTESIHDGDIVSLLGRNGEIRKKLYELYPDLDTWFPEGLSNKFKQQFCNQRRLFG